MTMEEMFMMPDKIRAADAENRLKKQNADQEMLFRQLYAKHIVKEPTTDATGKVISRAGDLNTSGFIKDAAGAGLSRDYINKYLDQTKLEADTNVDLATKDNILGALGSDYKSGTRAGSQYGEPAPQYVPNKEYKGSSLEPAAPPAAAKNGQSLSDVLPGRNFSAGMGIPKKAPTVAKNGQSIGDMFNPTPTIQDDNTINIKAAPTMQAPIDSTSPTTLVPGVDNRTSIDAVRDSKLVTEADPIGVATGAAPEANPTFEWSPVDNGSNQYQQYKASLDAKLKAVGMPDASTYLKTIYDNTIKSNTPAAPSALLNTQGVKGMSEYQTLDNAYKAAMVKAKGMAQDAVLKAREALAKDANDFGVATVEQRKSEVPDALLRDPAKRNEYSSLAVNKELIPKIEKELGAANTFTDVMMAAPQVFRAASTVYTPGQQLSTGNIQEQMMATFPEMTRSQTSQAIVGIAKDLFDGSTKSLEQTLSGIGITPDIVRARLLARLNETKDANEVAINNYIVREPRKNVEVKPEPAAPTGAPSTGKPFTWDDFNAYMESQKAKAGKPRANKPATKATKRTSAGM